MGRTLLPEKRVYLIGEIAEALGVHRSTVWRWINTGTLPALRRGRIVRILREDLETFLEEDEE